MLSLQCAPESGMEPAIAAPLAFLAVEMSTQEFQWAAELLNSEGPPFI